MLYIRYIRIITIYYNFHHVTIYDVVLYYIAVLYLAYN